MASPTIAQNQPAGDVRLLCDLTPVIEYFRRTFRGEELQQLPEFVVCWTTPVFLGASDGVEVGGELESVTPEIASRYHACHPDGRFLLQRTLRRVGIGTGTEGRKMRHSTTAETGSSRSAAGLTPPWPMFCSRPLALTPGALRAPYDARD